MSGKALKYIKWAIVAIVLIPVLHYGRRILICDSFIVKGHSMEPTWRTGEKVYVNKPVIGARIYRSFDFNEDTPLKCFRLPGLRKLRPGDVAIMNMPYGWKWGKISFKLNYVYLKRCIGCPGDTISIVDCHYINSSVDETGIPTASEARLRAIPDAMLIEMKAFGAGEFAGENSWTVKNFGPLPVPGKGTSIVLDEVEARRYSKILEYETGYPAMADGSTYTFRHDYYFFAGDNVTDSRDSRHFGFVPDDFIIGVIRK